MNLFESDDPLAIAIKPPPSESALDRENRIRAEQEAKRRSDLIDEELRAEKEAKRKQSAEVKVSFAVNVHSTIIPYRPARPPTTFPHNIPIIIICDATALRGILL